MSESKENLKGATAEAPVKKLRRGVSNETRAVNQLLFHEKDASPANGLFVGQLVEVRVDWSTNSESATFTGMAVPRLTYHFTSCHANPQEQRHVYQTLFPVESNVSTIPNGKEAWKVNNILKWIKHVLDVYYLKGRQLTPEEEDALALPFCDFDENGEYVAVDVQEVIDGYAALFNNVVAIMEGKFNAKEGETPKCYYKDANGNPLKIWMKLLRHRRNKDGWTNVGRNGELGFDQFIGAGCIELQKPNTPPAILRIDFARESITPKETKKVPSIGAPMAPGMGGSIVADPSMGMAGGMPAGNPAFDAAGAGEMPF